MPKTIDRLFITVAGATYPLAPLEDVDSIKGAIIEAVRSGGGFIDVEHDDGHRVSILVTASSVIHIAAHTLRMDTGRADGEEAGGHFAPSSFTCDTDEPYDLI